MQRLKQVEGLGALFPLAVICVFLCVFTDTFASYNNIMQVLRQAAVYAIMGTGMTFVIISGAVDLSQGSLLAFCCVFAGMTINATGNMWLGMLVAVVIGALAGSVNGLVIAFIKIPPFIMTLGTMYIFRGLTLWVTNSTQIAVNHERFKFIGQGFLLGIPFPVYVFIAIGILAHVILSKTATGRYVYAIGSNAETARIERNIIKIYAISGISIGLAAIVYMSRLSAAQPTAGQSYEMEAIAAAVIGGVSMSGGSGSVFGTLIGAVTVAVIRNGLVLLGVQSYFTQIVVGAIIVVAVSIDFIRKRIAASR